MLCKWCQLVTADYIISQSSALSHGCWFYATGADLMPRVLMSLPRALLSHMLCHAVCR